MKPILYQDSAILITHNPLILFFSTISSDFNDFITLTDYCFLFFRTILELIFESFIPKTDTLLKKSNTI